MIGRQTDITNISNELSDDDFDQITNLLEQIDQFSDCLETDDAKENGLAKKMIVKMDEAKADTLNHEVQIEKVSNSSCLPPFIPNTLFSEADMDSFLESRKIQSNDAVAVKRIYSISSSSSEEKMLDGSKKPKLPQLDSSIQNIRLPIEIAKKIKNHLSVILKAKSNVSGQIAAFCLFCNQKLEMGFCAWKLHFLKHTKEAEFYCTGCNVSLPSIKSEHCMGYEMFETFSSGNDLMAFMCNICNYIQVNMHRVIEHITQQHANRPENHMERVLLLPDLQPRMSRIWTNLICIPGHKRYICPIRGCNMRFPHPSKFKAHFLDRHRKASQVLCPHCQQMIRRNNLIFYEFFEIIIKHFFYHGSILNQCNVCDVILTNDTNIIRHILANHGNETCRYRRDFRKIETIDRIDDVIVIFECSLCKTQVDSSGQALRHFLKSHKSHHADFTLIQFVKETCKAPEYSNLLEYVQAEKGQNLAFQQHFMCNLCNELFTTKILLTRHYGFMHRSNHLLVEFSKNYLTNSIELSKRLDLNLDFDQYLVYYCGYCSLHSATFYADINEVYDHHSSSDHGKNAPFRFTVAQMTRCRYCDVISTFDGMKKHQAEQHSMRPFVFENLIDSTKCGLCLDGFDDTLVKHFDTDHQLVLKTSLFNPIALDGDTLKKLLNLKGHKKHKCGHCSEVFQMKDEFHRHQDEKHARFKAKSDKIYNDKSIHLIAGCCEAEIEPNNLFAHFKGHNILSKIRLKTFYWETTAVFGNGLILNKHNLRGTEYDDSNEFEVFLRDWLQGK